MINNTTNRIKVLCSDPCFSVHSQPHLLYNLPKRSKLEKFEDALLCQSPLVSDARQTTLFCCCFEQNMFQSIVLPSCWQEKTLSSPSDHKPSLLALTANNWLYRLSAETGEELDRVFLSSKHKFRYVKIPVCALEVKLIHSFSVV